jgi:hypothetical protein
LNEDVYVLQDSFLAVEAHNFCGIEDRDWHVKCDCGNLLAYPDYEPYSNSAIF